MHVFRSQIQLLIAPFLLCLAIPSFNSIAFGQTEIEATSEYHQLREQYRGMSSMGKFVINSKGEILLERTRDSFGFRITKDKLEKMRGFNPQTISRHGKSHAINSHRIKSGRRSITIPEGDRRAPFRPIFSADEKRIAYVSYRRGDRAKFEKEKYYSIHIFNLEEVEEEVKFQLPESIDQVDSFYLNPEFTCAFLEVRFEKKPKSAVGFDLKSKTQLFTREIPEGQGNRVRYYFSHPDTKQIFVVQHGQSELKVWDARTGETKKNVQLGIRMKGTNRYNSKFQLSPNGKWFAILNTRDARVHVFETKTWKKKYILAPAKNKDKYLAGDDECGLAWNADSTRLVGFLLINFRGSSPAFLEWQIPEK